MQKHTIGEIFRGGMLKNHKGEAYSDKASVSKVVSHWDCEEKQTPWGMGKFFSSKDIEAHNSKW